jgi:CrcB protein
MVIYFWIAFGGLLGTIARYALTNLVAILLGEGFPWGTLIINVTGSFAISFFFFSTSPDSRYMVRPEFRAFFMVGICGGYTTFSSYSLKTLQLVQDGQLLYAGGNVLASNVLSLLAVWLGYICAMALRR